MHPERKRAESHYPSIGHYSPRNDAKAKAAGHCELKPPFASEGASGNG